MSRLNKELKILKNQVREVVLGCGGNVGFEI